MKEILKLYPTIPQMPGIQTEYEKAIIPIEFLIYSLYWRVENIKSKEEADDILINIRTMQPLIKNMIPLDLIDDIIPKVIHDFDILIEHTLFKIFEKIFKKNHNRKEIPELVKTVMILDHLKEHEIYAVYTTTINIFEAKAILADATDHINKVLELKGINLRVFPSEKFAHHKIKFLTDYMIIKNPMTKCKNKLNYIVMDS